MNKEQLESRIKEIEAGIINQGQYVQQMNNQILMFHGAKEELTLQLKRLVEAEKLAESDCPVAQDDLCGEASKEPEPELAPASNE